MTDLFERTRPMNERDWLAERFEANRTHVRAMVGSSSDSKAALQVDRSAS